MLWMRELHWHITVLALAPFRSAIDFDSHRTPFQTPEKRTRFLLSESILGVANGIKTSCEILSAAGVKRYAFTAGISGLRSNSIHFPKPFRFELMDLATMWEICWISMYFSTAFL